MEDSGKYLCMVNNSVGGESVETVLTVTGLNRLGRHVIFNKCLAQMNGFLWEVYAEQLKCIVFFVDFSLFNTTSC